MPLPHHFRLATTLLVTLMFLLTGLAQAKETPAAAPAAQRSGSAKVDLNTATQKELEELPGVGEATAKKILAGRPYKAVGELEKAGLSEKDIAKIASLVTVGATPSSIDLNTATQKQLEDFPGVGEVTAKKIIAGRPYKSVQDLAKAGVSESEIDKLKSLVSVAAENKIDLNTASAKELEELPGVGKVTADKIIANRPYKSVAELEKAGMSAKEISKVDALVSVGGVEARVPPEKGMVWVNTGTGVYHLPGDRWYGRTKEGKFMREAEAKSAGYHESKEDDHSKKDVAKPK